ncbi:MAG: hypothetical protein J3R72DRAFT_433712 [Linnemannia gamsii]|nr:MAG: hypothetical protein J3R72DRAFT_433712 [Linnemannia gamsii]
MKFTSTIVSTLATFTLSSTTSAQFTNLSTRLWSIVTYAGSNYTIIPSPCVSLKPICLTATSTLSSEIIEGADHTMIGRAYGRIMYANSHDACALLAANGTPCPAPAGPSNLNLCISIRPNFPSPLY